MSREGITVNINTNTLSRLLNSQLSTGVGYFNMELLGTLNDGLSSLGRDAVGDLGAIFSAAENACQEIVNSE